MPKKTARKRKATKAASKDKEDTEDANAEEEPKEEEDEVLEDGANAEDAEANGPGTEGAEVANDDGKEEAIKDESEDEDINPGPAKMAKTEINGGANGASEKDSSKADATSKTNEVNETAATDKGAAASTAGISKSVENPTDSHVPTKPVDPPSSEPEEAIAKIKEESTISSNISNPGINPGTSSNPGKNSDRSAVDAETQVSPAPKSVPPGVPSENTTAVPIAAVRPPTVVAPVVAPVPVTQQPQQNQSDVMLEEKGEVSTLYVGRVIGKGGEMIRDLQARSGCRIDVDQNVPEGHPRIITYRGTRSTIDFAKQLVQVLCTERGKEAELPLGKAVRKQILVPSTVIGKIIGRGGEMIRELQSKSQAKIQVDHTGGGIDASQRQVTVTGTDQSVVKAEEMILFLCANPAMDAMQAISMLIKDKAQNGGVWGSGPPYVNMPHQGQGMPGANDMGSGMGGVMYGGGGGGGGGYGGQSNMGYGGYGGHQQQGGGYGQQYGSSGGGGNMGSGMIDFEMYPCAKQYMGRVIGQKGVTINDLQKRSGCDIQINQNVPMGHDCEISIKGTRQGIDMAKQMLQEIIEMGPNHPYAGGHGQFGGGNQYGRQQGYQQQPYQQSGYSQGYQSQSFPPQYGMQQPYGGQGMYQQHQQQQPHFQPQQGPPFGAQPGVPAPYGVPPVQASPWRTATAADGQIYYYNEKTGETQWDKPAGMP